MIAKGQMDKARQFRTEALEIFWIAACIDRGKCPAVKRALESDDVKALGLSIFIMEFSRCFHRAFNRFRTRISKKNFFSKGQAITIFLGELFGFGQLEHA